MSNAQRSGLIWGMLLIGAGVVAFAQQFGVLKLMPDAIWVIVFAVISLIGFASYALSGAKQWGWLFPAGVFGGLAIITGLALAGINTAATASALFIGLLLPFAAAYLQDRTHNWWALIPGGAMLFLTLVTLLADSHSGEWIGSMFLFLIGLSFFVVYWTNRTRRWALLVAYILGVLSLAPLMSSIGRGGAYYGAVFLLGVALPFLYIYFTSPDKWWALIPASAFIALSLITVAGVAGWIHDTSGGGNAAGLLLAALAAAFALIWMRHGKPWAQVVTIALAALAVVSAVFAAHADIVWPLAMVLIGAYVLYTSMRKKVA